MDIALDRVFDALPGLLWTARPDGQIDFVSDRWCDYAGRSVADVRRHGWQDAVYPEDRARVLEQWCTILGSGNPGTMEARLRRFDGEYRWFLISTSRLADGSGQAAGWCGLSIDIEDRKRAEDDARMSERRFRLIVDGLPALVSVLTPAGDLVLVNRTSLDYGGVTLEELKGQAFGESLHPDDREAVRAAWSHSVATGHPFDAEYRQRRADGVYCWFHGRGFPLCDSQGRIDLWYQLQTDVDDRRRAEALLAAEKCFLEMVAGGCSMPGILAALCHLVENASSGCYCSVVLVDESGACLAHGAAPSLPDSFIASIVGRPVSVESGPCAMASYLNQQVIAADLTSETRWAEYAWCPMALAHGLRACWSTPISSSAGKVLGAFALYYTEPHAPTPQHQALIEQFTHIASIAIERAVNDAALKRSEARKAAILDSALDCIVTIDHEGRITEFNPAAERTFGHRRDEVVGEPLADILIPPSLRERHRRGLAHYLATGDGPMLGKRVEITALRADGSEFPTELAITRIPVDGPPSFTGYLRDITERKRSEEELRRSATYLAQGQRLTHTGLWIWNPFTDRLAASADTYRIFGFDPEQTTALTLRDFPLPIHPDDRELFDRAIEAARRKHTDFEVTYRIVHPDGTIGHMHAVGHPVLTASGELCEFVGTVMDVTERTLAEEAQARRARQVALRTDVSTVLATADSVRSMLQGCADALVRQLDVAFARIWTLRRGSSVLELEASAGLYTTIEGRHRRVPVGELKIGRIASTRAPHLTNDVVSDPHVHDKAWAQREGMVAFAGYPLLVEDRVVGVMATFARHPLTPDTLDTLGSITDAFAQGIERKWSEEELRRSEAFLAEAQHVSATGSFSWRVATDEITWSEQVYRMFELDPAVPVTLELIGSRVHPDDLPMLDDMIGRARGDGSDFEYEHRLLMPDCSIKYLHMVGRGTRDQRGHLEYIGAVQDVTERRRAEEALGRLRSELARVARVTTLGTLAASIAHEVNQPLAGIITNAGTCLRMLAADPPNVEGARETARRTLRDGNRASDVTTRLRALFSSKDPRNESVDLNDALREVIALSMSELQRNGVRLRSELADDLPPVMGDRVQLQQVILNLLLNASQAMSDVDDRPRQLVVATAVDDRDQVRLSVQDAGTGIAAESAETLFDAFYTTKSAGMGIGLSVSRSIIESHRGRIWAVPNDGPGATFSFWLPSGASSTDARESVG